MLKFNKSFNSNKNDKLQVSKKSNPKRIAYMGAMKSGLINFQLPFFIYRNVLVNFFKVLNNACISLFVDIIGGTSEYAT